MIPILDFDPLGLIVSAIMGLSIIALIAGTIIAFLIYRFLSSLEPSVKLLLIVFFLVVGFLLILSAIGAGIGAIMLVVGAMTAVFNLIPRPALEE